MKNNTKTTLITILTGIAMILIAIIASKNTAYAATYIENPVDTDCPHTNTTVLYDKNQEADCTHTLEKSGRIICNDCGQIQYFVQMGDSYQHGPLEFVDESTESTCVSNGWCCWHYRCTLCGEKVSGGIVPKQKVSHPYCVETGMPVCYEEKKEFNADLTVTEGVWCSVCNCWVTEETRDMTEDEMNEFQTSPVPTEEQMTKPITGSCLKNIISRICALFEQICAMLKGTLRTA